jgi:hypothetical protein
MEVRKMSHDLQAAWASTEIADLLMKNQTAYFGNMGTPGGWSVYTGRESGRQWPLADGVILAENTTSSPVKIALEYKRPNEGLHGVLTALGQSLAYLEKGYDSSVVVIPEKYTSHLTPGEHLKRILDSITPDSPVSIYTYTEPNYSALKPFDGKIQCVRDIILPSCRKAVSTSVNTTSGDVSTLWAHMREGMSYPDAFFKYCHAVKLLSSTSSEDLSFVHIPEELSNAISIILPGTNMYKYLSHTSGNSMSEKVWRRVWFSYYFWNDLMPIYNTVSPYTVNAISTKIKIDDTCFANLFSGRINSIKEKLVLNLNNGTMTVGHAWEEYAKKVRKDAHSYREVIDSGLFHIGFLLPDGNLSDLGYKYVDACERISSANAGIPMEILGAALLQNGQYAAFLHYIYQLSEQIFSVDPFAFTEKLSNGKYKFDQDSYLKWIDNEFANNLHIVKKSTIRAGGTRKPFQAEFSFLKKMGYINGTNRKTGYRIGMGLEINWPKVQNGLMYFPSI